jgi:transposase
MDNGRREPRRMRYSLESRLRIVRMFEAGMAPGEAAAACGASRATGYRLWRRYQAEGWAGLVDRRSTPIHQPRRLSKEAEAQIIAVRLELRTGPQMLSRVLDRPASTIGKVLRRAGCSRLPGPDRVVRQRYERERPGELLHVDVKRLGRFWKVGKHRARALSGYLRWYNNHRPHGSLAALPPISRVSHVRGYCQLARGENHGLGEGAPGRLGR